jgi:hypothetical protein
VRVVEAAVAQQRPAPPAQFIDTRQPAAPPQQQQATQAPPPARGVAVRGRPSGEEAPPPSGQGAQPAPATQPAAAGQPGAAQPAPAGDKPDSTSGDDASARFSLLELD